MRKELAININSVMTSYSYYAFPQCIITAEKRIGDLVATSDLAIRTLQKALDSQHLAEGSLILHSDQGSQYTSKAFTEFCGSVHVTQSMSKAGYPYDNAPMERYFNTLKNECINLYEFRTEEELYRTVEEFAYVTYNHSQSGTGIPERLCSYMESGMPVQVVCSVPIQAGRHSSVLPENTFVCILPVSVCCSVRSAPS